MNKTFQNIKKLSSEDKIKKVKEAQLELLKLRAQISQGTVLKSPGQVKLLKKTIARIHTADNQEV